MVVSNLNYEILYLSPHHELETNYRDWPMVRLPRTRQRTHAGLGREGQDVAKAEGLQVSRGDQL